MPDAVVVNAAVRAGIGRVCAGLDVEGIGADRETWIGNTCIGLVRKRRVSQWLEQARTSPYPSVICRYRPTSEQFMMTYMGLAVV